MTHCSRFALVLAIDDSDNIVHAHRLLLTVKCDSCGALLVRLRVGGPHRPHLVVVVEYLEHVFLELNHHPYGWHGE